MATPLDAYANLTVAYKVPGTASTGDSGNAQAVATDLILIGYVKAEFGQGSASAIGQSDNGEDFHRLRLKGYCLAPLRPSAEIRPGATGDAILWRLSPSFSLIDPTTGALRTWASLAAYETFVAANAAHVDHRGKFAMTATLASQFVIPDELLGKTLAGTLTARVGWGEVI